MDSLFRLFIDYANFVIQHQEAISALTAVSSWMCGLAIWKLGKKSRASEGWAWYLAAAFITFGISYTVSPFAKFLGGLAIYVVSVPCSILNNIFFWLAASELFKQKTVSAEPLLPSWRHRLSLFATLPWGIRLLVGFSLIALISPHSWLFRMPDALLSSICLFEIGRATASNISLRSGAKFDLGLKAAAWAIALLYAFTQLLYAFNPIIASVYSETLLQWFQLTPATDLTAFLDQVVLAGTPPVKIGLFFSALLALMRSILVLSLDASERMLTGALDARGEYLGNDGLLRSIGEELGAEVIQLVMRLPGEPSRVASFKWRREELNYNLENKSKIRALPASEESVTGMVLQGNGEIIFRRAPQKTDSPIILQRIVDGFFSKVPSTPNQQLGELHGLRRRNSVAIIPIRFHGAVIGCLRAVSQDNEPFNTSAIQQLRAHAALVAPFVQSRREMAAIDQLGYRFARWRNNQKQINSERDVKVVTHILHSTLSPLATLLCVDVGFRRFAKFEGEQTYRNVLESNLERHLNGPSKANACDLLDWDLEEGPQRQKIGKAIMAVPPKKDKLTHPILGTQQLHQTVISAILADALYDLARDHFSVILKELGVALNEQELRIVDWASITEHAAKQAGLLWAAASLVEGGDLFGSPEAKKNIKLFLRNAPEADPISDFPFTVKLHNLKDQPIGEAQHIIEIGLPVTKANIWLGVARKGFGQELITPTPWHQFVERFADITDSALHRITTLRNLEIEARQARAVVAIDTIMHQLSNLVRDVANPLCTVRDALLVGELMTDDEELRKMILDLPETTEQLNLFTSTVRNIQKLDKERPCYLSEVAQQSEKLFSTTLAQKGIRLTLKVDASFQVDLPYYVAFNALNNLISNAKDAMQQSGTRIRIEAEDKGDTIECHVSDEGPGVSPAMIEQVFEPGVSGKSENRGDGLYLIRRSMLENRGNIVLAANGSRGATFTLRFPKVR